MKTKDLWRELWLDFLAGTLFACGMDIFAKPAGFAPGGLSGLALIGNHLWGLPIGVTTLALNIPIILLCYKVVGRKFLLKSLRTMLFLTVMLDLVFPRMPHYTGDALLASLYAGVFVGAGLACAFLHGSSTGGSDFVTMTVKTLYPHLSVGRIVLVTDAIIIALGGLVYGSVDAMLYGAVCTFISSSVLDHLLYGAGAGKLAIIITSEGYDTAKQISASVGRGATLLGAVGAYSGEARYVVLCACGKSQIVKVRRAAYAVDPKSFVAVTEAGEVYGQGFTPEEQA